MAFAFEKLNVYQKSLDFADRIAAIGPLLAYPPPDAMYRQTFSEKIRSRIVTAFRRRYYYFIVPWGMTADASSGRGGPFDYRCSCGKYRVTEEAETTFTQASTAACCARQARRQRVATRDVRLGSCLGLSAGRHRLARLALPQPGQCPPDAVRCSDARQRSHGQLRTKGLHP